MKKIIILGSTGSIGKQTLDCVNAHSDMFSVAALSACSNIDLLEEQIRKYSPEFAAVADIDAAKELKTRISDTDTVVLSGAEGILEMIDNCECDMVVNGIVGVAGMLPTYHAVKKEITVALANKESLVVGGNIIMAEAEKRHVRILPVDSEHSAIFQCLNGINPTEDDISLIQKSDKLKKLIITASGGAFFGKSEFELKFMKASDALKHPNWNMGAKITVDCATMFNKGFEIIEASHIFGIPMDKIDVIIHRESIIHSMIEFCDNSILAQLGLPDMRTAIQYALTYPNREPAPVNELDFAKIAKFSFYTPDDRSSRAMNICRSAQKHGGTMPTVLNAANECAVREFLCGNISFTDIVNKTEDMLNRHKSISVPTMDDIIDTDRIVRENFSI